MLFSNWGLQLVVDIIPLSSNMSGYKVLYFM